MDGATPLDEVTRDRQAWMGLVARAQPGRVTALLDAAGPRPVARWLRRPEVGTVMVRGRAGGTGAAFNLGEMTVTRCALEAAFEEGGIVGHGWVQGRDREGAEAAAMIDAMMRTDRAGALRAAVLDPLASEEEARRAARAGRAAATRVEFLTLARGEA